MLKELHISNYALIDSIDIDFSDGFNAITGETGAGKSILMSALALLLGGRADLRAVTDRERRSVIEGVFSMGADSPAAGICRANDIDMDSDGNGETVLIVRREISAKASGRSRAFVNDSPVALNVLAELGLHLVDIHSQHQNQLLATPAFQLSVIDRCASNDALRDEYLARFRALRRALRELKAAKTAIEDARREEDLIRYRHDSLAALDLRPGEAGELEKEQELLANISAVKEALGAVTALICGHGADGDSGALDNVERAARAVRACEIVLPKDADIPARLETAAIELADIAASLRDAGTSTADDPARLQYVEQRLADIRGAMRANSVDSPERLIELRKDYAGRLATLDDGEERLKQLRASAREAKRLALEAAARLSESRAQAARALAAELKEKAMPLGMRNLEVEIALTPADLGPSGADKADFRFAFNKNQTPMSLGNTASGGEISRLMLATKYILASRMTLPTIVFDEIDTGVSGEIAGRMGRLMKEISRNVQVVAITHLPQVAAQADTHFRVFKSDDDDATHTRIAPLDAERRVEEVAAMLSGDHVTDAARQNARQLIENPTAC